MRTGTRLVIRKCGKAIGTGNANRTRCHSLSPRTLRREWERRGSALVVVLVVITLVSLAVYTFSDSMILENEASEFAARAATSRAAALSGIEYAAAIMSVAQSQEVPPNFYHDPTRFAGQVLRESNSDRGRCRFSLVAPVEADQQGQQIRFGLIDESSKMNINAIPGYGLSEAEARTMFLSIPGMTEEIADAILDFIDSDSDKRQYGSENDHYEAKQPPYQAKNGKIRNLDELLLVEGVTATLLYGEDANHNGLLDPNENDGDLTAPSDNADGMLELGWSAYLTVSSRETNLQPDGTAKINLNEAMLSTLYDELALELDKDIAQFIVGYRMSGASNVNSTPVGGPSSNGSAAGAPRTTGNSQLDQSIKGVAQGVATMAYAAGNGQVTRDGMNLSQAGSVEIRSLYDLVDAKVTVTISNQQKTLNSPLSTGTLTTLMPKMMQKLSPYEGRSIDGRINITQARREILLGIPNMPAELADHIVSAQRNSLGSSQNLSSDRQTTAWLITENLTDLDTIRMIEPFITCRGDVCRVQSIGHFDRGGPQTRMEAILDASERPVKIMQLRDLTPLGNGYSPDKLMVPSK